MRNIPRDRLSIRVAHPAPRGWNPDLQYGLALARIRKRQESLRRGQERPINSRG